MRIIAGRFKGVAVAAPKTGTRPTTDRVKEAIFSHLTAIDVLQDARVLDLFAGSGALGFEALSRGARVLTAVDSSLQAVRSMDGTVKSLQTATAWDADLAAQVVSTSVERFVTRHIRDPQGDAGTRGAPGSAAFDLIFADPPYSYPTRTCEVLLDQMSGSDLVREGTMLVLERSTRSPEPDPPRGWWLMDAKNYGETRVHYLRMGS